MRQLKKVFPEAQGHFPCPDSNRNDELNAKVTMEMNEQPEGFGATTSTIKIEDDRARIDYALDVNDRLRRQLFLRRALKILHDEDARILMLPESDMRNELEVAVGRSDDFHRIIDNA